MRIIISAGTKLKAYTSTRQFSCLVNGSLSLHESSSGTHQIYMVRQGITPHFHIINSCHSSQQPIIPYCDHDNSIDHGDSMDCTTVNTFWVWVGCGLQHKSSGGGSVRRQLHRTIDHADRSYIDQVAHFVFQGMKNQRGGLRQSPLCCLLTALHIQQLLEEDHSNLHYHSHYNIPQVSQ